MRRGRSRDCHCGDFEQDHGSRNGCCFWKFGQRLVVVGAVDVAADSHRLFFCRFWRRQSVGDVVLLVV